MNTPEISTEKRPMVSDVASVNSSAAGITTVSQVQSKLIEFSKEFNSSYRLALLNCSPSERHNLIYLLISLKKDIKYALEDLGKSLRNREYQFSCGLCDEQITINPNEDIWSSLQDHEHFEELFYQFLNNNLDIRPVSDSNSESDGNLITEDASNTDSGIEQQDMEPSTSATSPIISTPLKEDSSPEKINSFRFNFNITYNEDVENKIYPSGIMSSVRKYDKVKEFTIMRAGNNKAACLICHCEMNGMRVTKHMLVNHAMGQRHLKNATDAPTLELLQFFHEFWLKEEPKIQAHQVYFRATYIPYMTCTLCGKHFHSDEVLAHITNDPHRKKVLEMFERRSNTYMLVPLQVQLYGISKELIEAREADFRLQEEARSSKSNATKNPQSPDDAKKMAEKPQGIEHNIIKSVEQPESMNSLDHLPNRMQIDRKFLKRVSSPNGSVIRCDLCKCDVPDKSDAIKNHLVSSEAHVSLKKDKYKYFCEICNLRVLGENEWIHHNFSASRHTNMAASRKAKVTEYECTTCKTVIYGDELSLFRHRGVGNRRAERGERKEKGTKLVEPVKKMFNSKENILAQASALAADADDLQTKSLTQNCCKRLETDLSEIFETCKVHPFGSRISGIGNKNSDLDVFVDTGEAYFGQSNQDPTDQVKLIRKAVKAFSKKKEYVNIVQVLTARTPILKLHHRPTQLDCDLSFKHGLSVENTKFLRFCIELQPVCQKLILMIKKWAELIVFESITTYALAILCIFYLQGNGYLLSVEQVRKLNNVETCCIGGWKTINYVMTVNEMKPHIKAYSGSVYDLLKEFFKFYAKFDFNSYVICPLLGRVVKRTLFSEDPQNLPPEMDAYVAQLERDDREEFRSNSHMCIQDPFDLSHNLTKAAQQGTLTMFQKMCALSLMHIEAQE